MLMRISYFLQLLQWLLKRNALNIHSYLLSFHIPLNEGAFLINALLIDAC